MLSFSQPWLLWALPLTLLPFLLRRSAPLAYSSLELLPPDSVSDWIGRCLRAVMTLAMAALLFALSGPYLAPQPQEQVGTGAQIVLLLDRSRSMDEPFAPAVNDGGAGLSGERRKRVAKGRVARDLLAAFAAERHNDKIAMLMFSTNPIPVLPLTDKTAGLVTAAHIDALPRGTLVVLVTRAGICDMTAVRRRVLAGELSLAADVFDVEPLPLDDPLLGHPNVVHTPHNAGRTKQAGERWAEMLLEQFAPV